MDLENTTKFHLMEINLISAQELKPVGRTKKMKTYAVAWINPDRKLTSRVDVEGHKNPTWNDKFVFIVDDQTLNSINTRLIIEIYAMRSLRKDKRIGTVCILLDNLIGSSNRYYEGVRGTFKAFQVRRPSGRPQGILNIGVIILEGLFREIMNGFMGFSQAVDHRTLMGGSREIVKKGRDFPAFGSIVNDMFCRLMPKKRRPKKIHQWP